MRGPTCIFWANLTPASLQELTDIEIDANRTAPVIGLIQSAWGGTEITSWIKTSSIACTNASGTGPQKTGGGGGVDAGLGRILALYYLLIQCIPKNTNIFGASISEATMRPNRRWTPGPCGTAWWLLLSTRRSSARCGIKEKTSAPPRCPLSPGPALPPALTRCLLQ